MRLTRAKNVLYFGLKCSKSRRFLGLRPRPHWGSLRRSPRPSSCERLLAFSNRSFVPSAFNPPLAPQNKNSHPVSPPNKIIELPLSWPTDPLNLAVPVHGSNDIVNVCVSYWGFIPKLQFKFCLILL